MTTDRIHYQAMRSAADVGPIVEITTRRKARKGPRNPYGHLSVHVTERWVLAETITLVDHDDPADKPVTIAYGVRLTAKGEADHRHISSIGGMHVKPFPWAREARFTGEYHRPEHPWCKA